MDNVNNRPAAKVLVLIPFEQMVRKLFNPVGHESRLQAAAGLAVEVADLSTSRCIENIVEQLGDMEFYVEAHFQALGGRDRTTCGEVKLEHGDFAKHQVLSTIQQAMGTVAGAVLEMSRQGLAVNTPLSLAVEKAMRYELLRMDALMQTMREMVGVQRHDVLRANQVKLGKLHPNVVYAEKPQADNGVLSR